MTRLASMIATCLLVAAGAAVADGASGPPFTVSSTLDGKTVLPHRIHWLGRTSLPAAKVSEVQFLIDGGKPRWVEQTPPYTFGDDFEGQHRGFLVTSWLTPGRHRFTVRALAVDGRTAERTVVARVVASPNPPQALAGTWQRTVADTSGAPTPGSAGNPTDTLTPAGTYRMVIDRRWIQVRFPGAYHSPDSDDTGAGWILDSDYSVDPTSFRVYGAVTFETHHNQAELGWWCWPDGPVTDYAWSVSGATLTLRPKRGKDPCGVRGFIWAGEWTRVR
jgi:hypothetical protein